MYFYKNKTKLKTILIEFIYQYPIIEIIIFDNQHINETNRNDLDDRFGPKTFASHNHAKHSAG